LASVNRTAFQTGARVGRFRLIEALDEGTMGRVWIAEGPSEPVAIKLLSLEAEGIRERFEREARALLKLRHPNVVRAIDYGEADDGTPFMAMELLEGESLEDYLARRGRLGVEEAIDITCAAAQGLGAAHALGIVHRDVKPGNLFRTADGQVKVLDFGIAFWSENDGRAPPTRLTAPGMVLGTPSYMAPEQAKGAGQEDVRTDVWGLGAVLYHALSGYEPFSAAGNYLGELTRILTEPPDPMPDDIPPNVAAVVLRALSKPREERFATMGDLIAALRVEWVPPARGSSVDVMGALSEEVRLVSAVLVEGLATESHNEFLDAVRRHGGVGSPVRGERAVAVFGGEEWLGDEAERAVKLALEVKARAKHIGIGTGKAVRRIDQRGVVTGEALAAAQQALGADEPDVQTLRPQALEANAKLSAAPVVVCPETARRLEGGFTLVGMRVVGTVAGGRALRPREVGGQEVPFVGRDDAFNLLIDVLEKVDEERKAAALVITGPPGIGKSRLRYEVMRWIATEEFEVRKLEARGEHGRASFGVVEELLRSHAGLTEGSDEETARARIEALVATAELGVDTARGTADFLGELLGVPFPENPHLQAARADPRLMADRIWLACSELFEGWTRRELVLVSIEDAQWADSASLAFLDSLFAQLSERPFLMIAAARPTFLVEQDAFDLAELVELGDLSDADIGRIVECLLGRPEPAVVERAAGNPYLAEELSLAVKEGADPDKLPLTVEGTVLARLDKLAPDEKDLLKRAAVLGRRFWREALEALGEPLATKLLAGLRRRDLVIPRPESRLRGCEEWLFRQAVVYEVCRGLLTDDQRTRLHKAAATWFSHLVDASPDEVADHFERAGEKKRAMVWWLRAMHAAHERGSSRDVLTYSERVIDPTRGVELPSSEAFAIRMLRCEAFHWLGDRGALEQELRALSKLSEEGDTFSFAALAEVRRWQAEHVQQSGHFEPAIFAARQAVRLADTSGSLDLRVRARATLSGALAASGALEEAAAVATETLDVAKQGAGSMIRASAARAIAKVEARRGNLSATLFYYGMARNLCLDVGALREATENGIGIGACLSVVGDYEQAKRIFDKTLKTADALALRSVSGWVKHHFGLALHRLGDTDAGLRMQDEAAALAAETADVQLAIDALAYRSMIEREAGDVDAALASAQRALETGEHQGVRSHEPLCRTLRAQALIDLGRHQEALDDCASVSVEQLGGRGEVALFLVRHDALVALGRRDEATNVLREAERWFDARVATLESATLRAAYKLRVPAHARLDALLRSRP
jgi:tetratricopeptide (TPR) repeat protein